MFVACSGGQRMRRTAMLWEVFVSRFEEAFEQYKRHRLTGEEAGELLGMSGRNFRRLSVRYEEAGIVGLRDQRIGRASCRERVGIAGGGGRGEGKSGEDARSEERAPAHYRRDTASLH